MIPYSREYKFQKPEGNLGLWSRPQIITLKSNDNLHSYQLVMEVTTIDKKQLSPASGLIYHEHKTKIIQKDRSGNIILEKVIFKDVFQETVD